MEVVVLIIVVIGLIILRSSIRSDAEQAGRNVCPNCGAKMGMNIFSRYFCPKCGWRQGHGYF